MKIVDSWKMNGKTAIYCTGEDIDAYIKKDRITIDEKEYKIAGFDLLTSISGIKSLMLLLDSDDDIALNQKIE